MNNKWYVAKTGNHQRLIVDENTGESIAVVYEKENADVVAAAPDLLEAAECALSVLNMSIANRIDHDRERLKYQQTDTCCLLETAIQKATDS